MNHFERIRRTVRTRRGTLIAVAAAATAIGQAPVVARTSLGDIPAAVAHAPAAVAELPLENVANVVRLAANPEARHLGFDTHSYPGDRAMRAWKEHTPYEWVGYYLPASCHSDESWSGTREKLEEMGWGMAVIYVGQQSWDGVAAPPLSQAKAKLARGERACHKALLSAERGRAEARDAIEMTAKDGFERGTVVYLDIEYMDRTPQRMREYYRAWVREVLDDGRFRPGIYVHTHNAALVYEDVKSEYRVAGLDEEPPFWVAGGERFSPEKTAQEGTRHAFSAVWQGVLDVNQSWAGFRLPIDVNVAAVPNPSSHEYHVPAAYVAMGD
ncbi:MAG TPA: glycoside hydrolase domain-containing protein [Gemmatimonadales bacterium]